MSCCMGMILVGGYGSIYLSLSCCSVPAVSLIDLLQIVRHYSVVGHAAHHRESLVTASSHEMDVMLKVPQAVPLWDLVYVHVHLTGGTGRQDKEDDHVNYDEIIKEDVFSPFVGGQYVGLLRIVLNLRVSPTLSVYVLIKDTGDTCPVLFFYCCSLTP